MRAALAQINSTVGDIDGNSARMVAAIDQAKGDGAALVVFPELALTGYPPEDLLLKRHFLDATGHALEGLADHARGIVALVGFPEVAGDHTYNAAAVLADGEVAAVYRKHHLPNYGVFDERRYFEPGDATTVFEVGGTTIGLTICEDIWIPGPPATAEAAEGAQVIVNLSASPYHARKGTERELMLADRARECDAAVLFCNMVGGQDELVFDGHSLALDREGRVVARAPQFEESLMVCEVGPDSIGGPVAPLLDAEAEVYAALRTGVRDYVDKNGFERVVFGLSGGIDSALVALVAVDALGPDRVTCVVMPSTYSTDATQSDARTIAANLGTDIAEIAIEPAMEVYERMLADAFAGTEPGIAEENLQARIRGNLVMALSNKHGWLVLTTGNKSELSVGYATLYGDMAGGFAVLKDVYKGWVYRLVEWRNAQAGRDLVPREVITRPPSAELRHDQRDDQSLPPYDVLDAILEGYIEDDLDAAALVARGFDGDDVERTITLVDRAEHKRRQAPPGIRITTRAFGRDRRLPITSRYRTRVSSARA